MRLFKTFNVLLLHNAAARMSAAESSDDGLRGLLDVGLTCEANQDTRSAHRIVGGTEAQPASWPWIVRFPMMGCAGSIIGPRTVVTAAHCCFTTSLGIYDFVAGKHSRLDNLNADPFTRRYRASAVKKHPSYTSSTFESDICLFACHPHPWKSAKRTVMSLVGAEQAGMDSRLPSSLRSLSLSTT
ncbi:Oidioi.mRNA.OKI2018_I69.PAR.g11646.t2.cds [Oikopleura dioica]|uniref:Oidioi.mRNA.OKI2018_I69.PAR.g11646.t2.cds n=1 Tax=Oikopleura dioica TaxID=34765 RepID=A0ABN7RZL7_OIKDI|nr:Oidioi.mRNA.OKI2018_I69.PAR.g11646.t2.cds [Oikopleura dioica]